MDEVEVLVKSDSERERQCLGQANGHLRCLVVSGGPLFRPSGVCQSSGKLFPSCGNVETKEVISLRAPT